MLPWARERQRLTLPFEEMVVSLAREMPVRAVARLLGEHDTRLTRVLDRYGQYASSRVSRLGGTMPWPPSALLSLDTERPGPLACFLRPRRAAIRGENPYVNHT